MIEKLGCCSKQDAQHILIKRATYTPNDIAILLPQLVYFEFHLTCFLYPKYLGCPGFGIHV